MQMSVLLNPNGLVNECSCLVLCYSFRRRPVLHNLKPAQTRGNVILSSLVRRANVLNDCSSP